MFAFLLGFADDIAAPFGRQVFAVFFHEPPGDVAGIDFHFEQLQVFITVKPVFLRVADPFKHGIGFGVQA